MLACDDRHGVAGPRGSVLRGHDGAECRIESRGRISRHQPGVAKRGLLAENGGGQQDSDSDESPVRLGVSDKIQD